MAVLIPSITVPKSQIKFSHLFPAAPCLLRRRLAPSLSSRFGVCLAAKPGRPSPQPDPSPEPPRRTEASLASLQERAQVFLGVLFWMFLFFWTCAVGGGDRTKPKGSRFRK